MHRPRRRDESPTAPVRWRSPSMPARAMTSPPSLTSRSPGRPCPSAGSDGIQIQQPPLRVGRGRAGLAGNRLLSRIDPTTTRTPVKLDSVAIRNSRARCRCRARRRPDGEGSGPEHHELGQSRSGSRRLSGRPLAHPLGRPTSRQDGRHTGAFAGGAIIDADADTQITANGTNGVPNAPPTVARAGSDGADGAQGPAGATGQTARLVRRPDTLTGAQGSTGPVVFKLVA